VRWTDIPGWFQWRTGQEEAARHFPTGSRFIEVGNYLGRSYHGDAVAEGRGTLAGELHGNVILCGYVDAVSLVVADSVTASTFFPDASIAWVHLDARHDREHLLADIAAWLPKVAPGGWLSGDDYDPVKWPDVVATVRERLPDAEPWSDSQWRLVRA
jgi:hypothetical protein